MSIVMPFFSKFSYIYVSCDKVGILGILITIIDSSVVAFVCLRLCEICLVPQFLFFSCNSKCPGRMSVFPYRDSLTCVERYTCSTKQIVLSFH